MAKELKKSCEEYKGFVEGIHQRCLLEAFVGGVLLRFFVGSVHWRCFLGAFV